MGLVGDRLRRGFHELLRPWIGAIVVLAIAGGAAAAAAGAARRTDTAYSSLLASHHAADAVVNFSASTGDADALDRIEARPSVTAHGRAQGVDLFRVANGSIDPRTMTGRGLGTLLDTTAGSAISRLQIVNGRAPAPDRMDEVVVTAPLAKAMGYKIGDHLTDYRLYRRTQPGDYDPQSQAARPGSGTPIGPLTIVGIGDIPEDVLAPASARESHIVLAPAFGRQYPDAGFYTLGFVKLRDGAAGLPAFQHELSAIAKQFPAATISVTPVSDVAARARRANGPIVNGLWLLAALAAVVGLLLAGQSIGRVLRTRLGDHAQLRALGATRAQRVGFELTGVLLALICAGVLAMLIGWVTSPLAPIGAARAAAAHPGFHFDVLALLGALAVIVAVGLVVAIPGLARVSRSAAVPGPVPIEQVERRSVVADAVASSGLGAPATLGTRLALQPGRGASATPVRSVLVSVALVIAAVTATIAFGANLDRLVSSPHLYGWNWDVAIGTTYGTLPDKGAHEVLDQLDNVPHVAAITLGALTSEGHTYPAIGLDPVRGDVAPVVLSGSLPQNADEIAVGSKTLGAMNREVGDTVRGQVDGAEHELRIVGVVTMPAFGNAHFAEAGLGNGVLGRSSLFKAKPLPQLQSGAGTYNYFLLRFSSPATADDVARVRALLAPSCGDPTCVVSDRRPDEIDGFRNARGLPIAIGVVLVLLLIATIAHVLLSTARRRSTDLAILRALGCSPRQLAAVMRWQAGVLVGLGLAIGVPIGLIGGTIAWRAFSHEIGVAPNTVLPVAIVCVLAVVTIALALVLASGAGVQVRRTTRAYRFGS